MLQAFRVSKASLKKYAPLIAPQCPADNKKEQRDDKQLLELQLHNQKGVLNIGYLHGGSVNGDEVGA
jgi:hypothetical protein